MSTPDGSNEESPKKTAAKHMVVVPSSPERREEMADSKAIELPEKPDDPVDTVIVDR